MGEGGEGERGIRHRRNNHDIVLTWVVRVLKVSNYRDQFDVFSSSTFTLRVMSETIKLG